MRNVIDATEEFRLKRLLDGFQRKVRKVKRPNYKNNVIQLRPKS
jgi:hypothetical protein